jgi:hypothetical protein
MKCYVIVHFGSKWSEVLSHVLRDGNEFRLFERVVQETIYPTKYALRQMRQMNGDDYTVRNFTNCAAQCMLRR